MIIARTDARAALGLDEAIERANRYAEAGADAIFIDAPESLAEVERIPKEIQLRRSSTWSRTVVRQHDHFSESAWLRLRNGSSNLEFASTPLL